MTIPTAAGIFIVFSLLVVMTWVCYVIVKECINPTTTWEKEEPSTTYEEDRLMDVLISEGYSKEAAYQSIKKRRRKKTEEEYRDNDEKARSKELESIIIQLLVESPYSSTSIFKISELPQVKRAEKRGHTSVVNNAISSLERKGIIERDKWYPHHIFRLKDTPRGK